MANNRLYLVHNPTGKKVMIGKRMGWGWYTHRDTISDKITEFYDNASESGENQDDFSLVIEDNGEAPHLNEVI